MTENPTAAGLSEAGPAIKAQNPDLETAWRTIAWWQQTCDYWQAEAQKGYATRDSVESIVAAHVTAAEDRMREAVAERDALAAAVDRIRRRHPRGDEESGYLAPGLWCPTCGHERSDNGYGGCPDRRALIIPGQPLRAALAPTARDAATMPEAGQ